MDTEYFGIPSAVISSIALILAYALFFLLGKWIKGIVAPYQLNHQLTEEDNPAVAISLTGYIIGMTIIFVSAVDGPHISLLDDLIAVSGYSLAGILCLNLTGLINDRAILYKFSSNKEIVNNKNTAVGVVQASAFIASALIIGGAIHGEVGAPVLSLVFFLIGQIILIGFSFLYVLITRHDDHKEIQEGNLAAGLGFAGAIISIGIIVMKAVSGEFISWPESLQLLAIDSSLVFVYIIFVRFFFDKLIIPHSDLADEIARDKNIGAGLLEMFVSIGFATVLFYTI